MTLAEFVSQWNLEDIPACEYGMELLYQFALKHPDAYRYMRPEDFVELENPAFSGIPEWDAFAKHSSTCQSCNEV